MDNVDPVIPAADVLFDQAACGLLLTDKTGRILRINSTACKWLGYSNYELTLRRHVQDLFTVGGRVFHQTHCIPILQVQGSVSEVQIDLLHCDQTRLPMLVNIVALPANGVVYHQFSLFIATERRAYERELLIARNNAEAALDAQIQAEAKLQETNLQLSLADRRKDEFLAMLAHELRNPLAPISAAAQLLTMICDDHIRVKKTGAIIGRQVVHLTNLIDDLLDVSRVNSGVVVLDMQSLDIAEVVGDAVEQIQPLINQRHHQIQVTIAQGLPTVRGDRKRLVQVVANLLQNAAKYTPEGGRLNLNVSQIKDDVCVTIQDNGVGIDVELLPYIFEPFTQEKRSSDRSQGGLGLGLAIVKNLITLHGGQVSVASDGTGQGATFFVRLPKSRVLPADLLEPTVTTKTTKTTHNERGLRVLVVDDNIDAALSLAMILETAGHQVDVVHESSSALKRARDESFDVYLLDIGLPEIDGNELARRIRTISPIAKPTLIAITGYGQTYNRQHSLDAGFDNYFVKPADPTKLLRLLSEIQPNIKLSNN
jgi:PAS domain S-box-containing protein